jgi:hypothetical protein
MYEAVASTTTIRGVGGTVSITPAKANGTITPWTESAKTVATAGTALNVAAGTVSAAGTGAKIMTGVGTLGTATVLTGATLASGAETGISVVTDAAATKNAAAKTISGTAKSAGAHEHEIA